ncbi:MAG: VTC domain-containing protein [Thermodesulfobacteriota bacterium]
MNLARVDSTGRKTSAAGKDIFELKYTSSRVNRERILATLRHFTDVPTEFPEAKVRTIYFDDRSDTSFHESVDGEIFKRKYRLREYVGSAEGARYSLEVKLRNDIRTSKVRELIYTDLPEGFRFTTFRALLDAFEESGSEPLTRIRVAVPRAELFVDTTIYYERSRFDDRYRDARYNLDTQVMLHPDIRSGVASGGGGGVYLDHDIFEIKSAVRTELPRFLSGFGLTPVAFSKFVWGKEIYF